VKLTSYLEPGEDLRRFEAGDVIFREGDAGDEMYVVQEGRVSILVGARPVATIEPEGICGEMALIEPAARSATAVALTDCKLVAVDRKRFRYLVQDSPYFALHLMKIMADRLRAMNRQLG
jgi:CRP/FNR family transcriptional regulator, cyclic AMP receptor protein